MTADLEGAEVGDVVGDGGDVRVPRRQPVAASAVGVGDRAAAAQLVPDPKRVGYVRRVEYVEIGCPVLNRRSLCHRRSLFAARILRRIRPASQPGEGGPNARASTAGRRTNGTCPVLAVVRPSRRVDAELGTVPSEASGSEREERISAKTNRSRSARILVAVAHSTASASLTSMSSSTTVTRFTRLTACQGVLDHLAGRRHPRRREGRRRRAAARTPRGSSPPRTTDGTSRRSRCSRTAAMARPPISTCSAASPGSIDLEEGVAAPW